MSLTAAPSPTWIYPNRESGSSHESRFDFFGSELVRFTLADGGRSLLLTQELHAIRRFGGDPRVSDGDVLLVGRADRQDPLEIDIPEPEPDPRIDDLLEEVGELSDQVGDLSAEVGDLSDRVDDLTRSNALLAAQLCEAIRLLNTPEGRRSADSDEVVEACGTAFEWTGEGTDAPGSRRGPGG